MNSLNEKYQEDIKMAEDCGLAFTGTFDEDVPVYIGSEKAWAKFDKLKKEQNYNDAVDCL
jgi:hypothetical protein